MRRLTFCALCLASRPAAAVEPITVGGSAAQRWLEGEAMGPYYEVPSKGELKFSVNGPGTLLVFVVNHRGPARRSLSTLLISLDDRPLKRLKLGCVPGKLRFLPDSPVLPCSRVSRDFTIDPGRHEIAVRLGQSKLGASAHFLFVTRAEMDAEPELIGSVAGPGGSAEEVSELDPLANEPELVAIETAETTSTSRAPGPLPLVLGGVGLLAGGAGTWFGLQSRQARRAADRELPQTEVVEHNERYRSNALVANALFAVSAVTLGAALLTWVAGDGQAPASVPPGGAGVSWVGGSVEVCTWLRF